MLCAKINLVYKTRKESVATRAQVEIAPATLFLIRETEFQSLWKQEGEWTFLLAYALYHDKYRQTDRNGITPPGTLCKLVRKEIILRPHQCVFHLQTTQHRHRFTNAHLLHTELRFLPVLLRRASRTPFSTRRQQRKRGGIKRTSCRILSYTSV